MDELERYRCRAAARMKALRRLGVTNIYCLCGESDPICFDADHIYRRMYDGTCWALCANCHRRKSFWERLEHPPVGMFQSDPFERLEHRLLGMRQYAMMNAEQLLATANMIAKLKGRGLDI